MVFRGNAAPATTDHTTNLVPPGTNIATKLKHVEYWIVCNTPTKSIQQVKNMHNKYKTAIIVCKSCLFQYIIRHLCFYDIEFQRNKNYCKSVQIAHTSQILWYKGYSRSRYVHINSIMSEQNLSRGLEGSDLT